MIQKTITKIIKIIITLIILAGGHFINVICNFDSSFLHANIDSGFGILVLAGLSYGSRKLYMHGKEQ
ncbi:MAG: hypothetical protein L3J56_03945 [Bacteroidales bacterium]|nr:hypothetical protein [Bacteroidales bacterium]